MGRAAEVTGGTCNGLMQTATAPKAMLWVPRAPSFPISRQRGCSSLKGDKDSQDYDEKMECDAVITCLEKVSWMTFRICSKRIRMEENGKDSGITSRDLLDMCHLLSCCKEAPL